jgi:hypothetical protein
MTLSLKIFVKEKETKIHCLLPNIVRVTTSHIIRSLATYANHPSFNSIKQQRITKILVTQEKEKGQTGASEKVSISSPSTQKPQTTSTLLAMQCHGNT